MNRCAIIGGGISGLTAAYFLKRRAPEIDVHLYEASDRLGGSIRTEIIDDCIVEAGPDSFLTQKQAAIDLCRLVGLDQALTPSNDATRKTFLYLNGKSYSLPEGFILMVPTKLSSLVKTDLLTWPGKLSALADLFAFPEETDLSAGEFIDKRFGQEILDRIAEPLLAGVYGADIYRLSLKSGLPQIWELQKRGSLIRNLVGFRSRAGADSKSLFTTLSGGMETLPKALVAQNPGVVWELKSPVTRVEKEHGGWKIGTEVYDRLLIASSSMPEINSEAANEIRTILSNIRRNSAIVIIFCFDGLKKEGFGWLVPATERHSVLAATYCTNKFPGRSPEDKLLVRLFIGGNQAAYWLNRPDHEIEKEALHELERIGRIHQTPRFCRIYRWPNAMPEYGVGHDERMMKVQQLLTREPNLYLTGNLFAGVGVPDCIRHAQSVAESIT